MTASAPLLAAGEVHLWHHRARAARGPAVAAEGRAVLLQRLQAYAGLDLPPALDRGPRGKPFAPALPGLEFNLSHAGADLLLAFACDQPLGVDIERATRRVSPDALAARFFAKAEAAALARLPPARRRSAFLHLWTHKEAVLKALGEGLAFGLDRIELSLSDEGRVLGLKRIADGPAPGWQLHAIEPAPGLVGALAWQGPPRALRWMPASGSPALPGVPGPVPRPS